MKWRDDEEVDNEHRDAQKKPENFIPSHFHKDQSFIVLPPANISQKTHWEQISFIYFLKPPSGFSTL